MLNLSLSFPVLEIQMKTHLYLTCEFPLPKLILVSPFLAFVSSRSACMHWSIGWLLIKVQKTWWFKHSPLFKLPPVFLLFKLAVQGSTIGICCMCMPTFIGIVCTPPPSPFLQGGRGVEPTTKFWKSGGLTRPQLLERDCWERGGWLFSGRGSCNFHIKNELKSEIFNGKKVYKQKCLSLS